MNYFIVCWRENWKAFLCAKRVACVCEFLCSWSSTLSFKSSIPNDEWMTKDPISYPKDRKLTRGYWDSLTQALLLARTYVRSTARQPAIYPSIGSKKTRIKTQHIYFNILYSTTSLGSRPVFIFPNFSRQGQAFPWARCCTLFWRCLLYTSPSPRD